MTMKNVCNKNTFSAIFPMQKNSDKIVTIFNCYGKLLIYSAAFCDVCAGEETAFGPCVPKKGL